MSYALTSPFRTELLVPTVRAARSRPPVGKSAAVTVAPAAVGPATTAAEERGQFGDVNVTSRNKWLLWTI